MHVLADRSNWNGTDDYALAQAHGLEGVWLKVGQGGHYSDPTWLDRRDRARRAGLRVGGYYYVEPGGRPVAEQAAHFASLLGAVGRRDLRPVLDLESVVHGYPVGALYVWASEFHARMRDLKGVCLLQYGSYGFLAPLRWSFTLGCGLWLAGYGPDDGRPHPFSVPPPWKHAAAHQFTSHGHWPGLQGNTDLTIAASLRPLLAHPLLGRL